jgi:hypothetical protein
MSHILAVVPGEGQNLQGELPLDVYVLRKNQKVGDLVGTPTEFGRHMQGASEGE